MHGSSAEAPMGNQSCLLTVYSLTDVLRGTTPAYPILVRHPKFHQDDRTIAVTTFLPSIQQGMASTSLVPVFGHMMTFWGDENVDCCFEVVPRGNCIFKLARHLHQKIYSPGLHPTLQQRLYTSVAGVATLCCI